MASLKLPSTHFFPPDQRCYSQLSNCQFSSLSLFSFFPGGHRGHCSPCKSSLLYLRSPLVVPLLRACATNELKVSAKQNVPPPRSISVILLSGGTGKRMGASIPKQYLSLCGQPIALHSFHTFARMKEVKEIVVVCDPLYQNIFKEAEKQEANVEIKFALPGKERQFSVLNGLNVTSESAKLVCIHDSARPLVSPKDVYRVLCDAYIHGAAVLGVQVKGTIKEAKGDGFVARTLDRSLLWEMQTPQVIEPSLLRKGFVLVEQKDLEVTDDVSIVEHLNHPVFITEGSYTNIKVTTPDDMIIAERLLSSEEFS